MARSIRITNEDLYKDLMRIQGEIQSRSGEFTSMNDTVQELVDSYRKKHK